MSYHTVTEIVRQKSASIIEATFSTVPNRKQDVPVCGTPFLKGKPRHRGTIMHEALAESLEGRWVDRSVWPFCKAAKGWLHDQGVSDIVTEVPLGTSALHGICDALASGGPGEQGLVEWKTCSELPDMVAPEAVFQLGLYASLTRNPDQTWGAVGYICAREDKIRVFFWTSLGACAVAAQRLAA
jgi:hypothetical protein